MERMRRGIVVGGKDDLDLAEIFARAEDDDDEPMCRLSIRDKEDFVDAALRRARRKVSQPTQKARRPVLQLSSGFVQGRWSYQRVRKEGRADGQYAQSPG